MSAPCGHKYTIDMYWSIKLLELQKLLKLNSPLQYRGVTQDIGLGVNAIVGHRKLHQ